MAMLCDVFSLFAPLPDLTMGTRLCTCRLPKYNRPCFSSEITLSVIDLFRVCYRTYHEEIALGILSVLHGAEDAAGLQVLWQTDPQVRIVKHADERGLFSYGWRGFQVGLAEAATRDKSLICGYGQQSEIKCCRVEWNETVGAYVWECARLRAEGYVGAEVCAS
jgi:hypothetical protein